MFDDREWTGTLKAVLAAGLVVALTAGCDGSLLDVDDPDNVSPQAQLTPEAVSSRFAGMVNDFREAYDDYALYTGLFTDEFILAGTFPTRIEVDERRPISNNTSINGDVWQPMSVSRATADAVVQEFNAALGTPEFADVSSNLQRGVAFGRLLGGYQRIQFAEFFCQSIFGGEENLPQFVDETPESSPRTSVERMREAVSVLESAETFATDPARTTNLANVATAARIGQARAHMFLGSVTGDASHFSTAQSLVTSVPSSFDFTLSFSFNTPGEENEVFQSTWGVNANIRWTVGNGTDASRGNESYAYLSEWLGQGLLIDATSAANAGLSSFNGRSPVVAQTLYAGRAGTSGRAAPMVLASGWEARMIEAEVLLRNGSPGPAEDMVNDLLESDQSDNPITSVQPTLTTPAAPSDLTSERLEEFEPVTFGDETLQGDLEDLARARAAGLWLTGQRQHYLRRLAQEFGDRSALGLYPDRAGNAISLPVPNQEVDNNQNIQSPCPSTTVGGEALP